MSAVLENENSVDVETRAGPRPSLLVFSDDWGRHPSSCQHLISRLLGDYDVAWVNTIGMRPPTLDWATLRRGVEKLRHWRIGVDHVSREAGTRQPQVVNPRMWPWFKRRHDRKLNRWLLTKQLNRQLKSMEQPVVAITTIPVVADIMDRLNVDKWIYYCVDDFGQWPGLDQATMAKMEDVVIRRADLCIAASEVLQSRLGKRVDDVELLTHGVDLSHWQQTSHTNVSQNDHSRTPTATFWGLIDRRLDRAFLEALAMQDNCRIDLVGPTDNPDPTIFHVKNVRQTPAVPYSELPSIAADSDVLIMPYVDAPVTRAMQPLKLLEYLATGKPVVARDLPATRPWADCLDLAKSPREFADLVALRVSSGLPHDQRVARKRLNQEDWAEKATRFEQLVVGGKFQEGRS